MDDNDSVSLDGSSGTPKLALGGCATLLCGYITVGGGFLFSTTVFIFFSQLIKERGSPSYSLPAYAYRNKYF
jgi:hypothetical protein